MRTLVVGDIHGQVEVVEKILDMGEPTVFVGDFMDSYTRSPEDCIESYRLALDSHATVLFGNHERSYMYPHMRCSGYNPKTQVLFDHLDTSEVKDYHWIDGILISHAGVSELLLKHKGITLDEYLKEGAFDDIGVMRGGSSSFGGLYWCDFNMDFEPVLEVPQVFGHTRGRGVRVNGNSYCIDCLEDDDKSIVAIENGKVEIISL